MLILAGHRRSCLTGSVRDRNSLETGDVRACLLACMRVCTLMFIKPLFLSMCIS